MRISFERQVFSLNKIAGIFEKGFEQKFKTLQQLSSIKLKENKTLLLYFETLLFLCAYPLDKKTLEMAEQELSRITSFIKRSKKRTGVLFKNTGLPYTITSFRFTHDFLQWLSADKNIKLFIEGFTDLVHDLNEGLRFTLPTLEVGDTTAGLGNDELLKTLKIRKDQHLSFLLDEFSKLNDITGIKDHLFDGLGMYVGLLPLSAHFSKSMNRIPANKIFFHDELLKRFDYEILLESKIPSHTVLSGEKRKILIQAIKNSMALTMRETDPATYMEENSLRLYELERGISIAIYGMIPSRQLPLESYVGYTLFKNGFPVSYGGCWVFGEHALFGINIFESFRGGESGYLMCQLLRLYRQVFKINFFEVEPYQFGLDNPEGIDSGAFWFYYKYGFRPIDHSLRKIAKIEHNKIKTIKKYRTSKSILKQFTQSNLLLSLEKTKPVKVSDVTSKVKRLIITDYKGNRLNAEKDCVQRFSATTRLNKSLNKYETQVLKEVALWSAACHMNANNQLNLLRQMIDVKPRNLYEYQDLVLELLKRN